MSTENTQDFKYRVLKALRGSRPEFINMTDNEEVEEFRRHYRNQDLLVSTWASATRDESALRNYDLCIHITAPYLEKARTSTLEACYYIEDQHNIAIEDLNICYNGGGEISHNNAVAGGNQSETSFNAADHAGENTAVGPNKRETGHIDPKTCQEADDGVHIAGQGHGWDGASIGADTSGDLGRNNAVTGGQDDVNASRLGRQDNAATTAKPSSGCGGGKGAKDGSSAAEIVISIPPVVFGGQPTPLVHVINCHLARQMADYGIENIDIDQYQRDSFIPLPNSINSATGRWAILLTDKELLYLDGHRIAELSREPRPDDSMVMLRQVPEAVEWFGELHAEFEKKQRRQDELRRLVRQQGWEVPPCIRRLLWLDADEGTVFEACRLISGTYSFLGSNETEIRYHVQRLARRNDITDFPDHKRLRRITRFGHENPWLFECHHPLLHGYCPGGCFMTDLIDEHEKPSLFKHTGEK